MRSKLTHTGELLIDHRNSPGIDPAWAAAHGVTGPVVGGGKIYETGLKNLVHFGADVGMNRMRQRDREWCWVCDAYICDGCGLLRKIEGHGEHKPYRQRLSEIY